MRKRVEALARTVAIQPTLELVQLMGHDAVVGFVHDKGSHIEVNPIQIDATGAVTLEPTRSYYHGAIFSRRMATDGDLLELRDVPDEDTVMTHLETCLGAFPGTEDHRDELISFLASHYDTSLLIGFMDDPTSALPYWENPPVEWPERKDIPF